MKTFELEQIGVQEMDAMEIKDANGGCLGLLSFPITCFALGYLYEKLLY